MAEAASRQAVGRAAHDDLDSGDVRVRVRARSLPELLGCDRGVDRHPEQHRRHAQAGLEQFIGSVFGAVWGAAVTLAIPHESFAMHGLALVVAVAPLTVLTTF